MLHITAEWIVQQLAALAFTASQVEHKEPRTFEKLISLLIGNVITIRQALQHELAASQQASTPPT